MLIKKKKVKTIFLTVEQKDRNQEKKTHERDQSRVQHMTSSSSRIKTI